ncbi:MAG: hypothetical protein ABW215_02590 [Kibdelosporangium sp.]
MTDHTRVAMPSRLKPVLLVMYLQVLTNAFAGVVIFDDVATTESHGARVPYAGALYSIAIVSFLVALILLACAVLTTRRYAWIRPTVITIEVISVISNLIAVFQGGPLTSIVGIGLGIAMIVALNREEIMDYYDQ